MTYLLNLTADPKGFVARMKIGKPEPTEVRKVVANLRNNGSDGGADIEAVGVVQQRIADWAHERSNISLSRRDLRIGAQALFHKPLPPSDDELVLKRLLKEIESNKRRAAFFAAIDAYLDGFDDQNQTILNLAQKLEGMTARWHWRDTDSWPQKISEFSLLNPARAPEILASRVLASEHDPYSIFQEAGLDTLGRRFGGLVEAAFRKACHLVKSMKGSDAVSGQRILIEWARKDDGDFGYERAWPDFVEASLTPWQIDEPSEVHKSALIKMLERFGGGDPRAVPSKWRSVMDNAPGAYSVLMRWLTRASVLQFLDIVDRLMPDQASKLMWAYRRAFWMSYLLSDGSAPGIDAAWVAFGDVGARLARQIAQTTGDNSFRAFGRQYDKTGQHAALILQIGDLTIVDWSHNAKYQVWKRGDSNIPEFFKGTYKHGELYSAPIQESHVSPGTFSWQKNLARIIEGRSFFSPKASWKPRRA